MNALEAVTLVDFGQYLAGPFGPMIIGDMGADVIKVEPISGDGMRNVNKPFFGCQRGKRDIALDLKTERGHEVAMRLIEQADIVHHNMTAGVARKLRIAYEDCAAVNSDVVYCNTWAYGLEGPLARFGGLDPLFQAATGIEYDAGPVRQGNPPLYLRFGMTDTANAMLSVVGCLAALYHRRRTGEGQELWTSLLDGAAVLAADAVLVDGEPIERPRLDKGQYGLDACYRLYATSDGGWIQIAAVKQEHWVGLCATLGVPHLADDVRFATAHARGDHRTELEAVLEPVFASRTNITWSRRLDDAGVPNQVPTESHDGELVLFDADNERLGLVTEYEHPLMGTLRQFGHLIDFSETPSRIAGPPPLVGQHTREILDQLGYSDAEAQALHDERVVYWPDDAYPWAV